jgi:uncharacterized protein YgiM (DUF1202 family)
MKTLITKVVVGGLFLAAFAAKAESYKKSYPIESYVYHTCKWNDGKGQYLWYACPVYGGACRWTNLVCGTPPLALGSTVEVSADSDLFNGTEVVGRIEKGERVRLVAIKGEWATIEHLDGSAIAGWIRLDKLSRPSLALNDVVEVTTNSDLFHGTQKVGHLLKGEKVRVVSIKGDWATIAKLDGTPISGWIKVANVKLSQ